MYKITLPINFDGYRYGIEFFKGVGKTSDEKVVQRMREKGFAVESISDNYQAPPPLTAPEEKKQGKAWKKDI